MGFVPFIPHRDTVSQISSQDVIEHAWHEIESRSLLPGGEDFAEFADQARRYFLDARKSDWRSAGLLYYYSLLNLAKVLLIKRGASTRQSMTTVAAYHGLAAEPQMPSTIADFSFEVHPTRTANGRVNLFALMYETLLGTPWPFAVRMKFQLREILPYIPEIAVEARDHFGVLPRMLRVQSMFRSDNQSLCFEILINQLDSEYLLKEVAGANLHRIALHEMNANDSMDWLLGAQRSRLSMEAHVLLRTSPVARMAAPDTTAFTRNCVVDLSSNPTKWWFVRDNDLNGIKVNWHPALSDYLFAYCLSTILRYQPHLLKRGSADRFLAEAWCRQSPSTVLRHFLIALTEPALLISRGD